MAETYIRSLYEDIYVDDESVGNGYYTYSGSWVSDANYYTTKKKRTDYLIGGYLLIQNAVNTTVL